MTKKEFLVNVCLQFTDVLRYDTLYGYPRIHDGKGTIRFWQDDTPKGFSLKFKSSRVYTGAVAKVQAYLDRMFGAGAYKVDTYISSKTFDSVLRITNGTEKVKPWDKSPIKVAVCC